MKPQPIGSRIHRRKRARSRGFSQLATTLEAAGVMAWFALVFISERKLDDAITARRIATSTTQDEVQRSAASCENGSSAREFGDVVAEGRSTIDSNSRLGLSDTFLPSLSTLGLTQNNSFGAQQSPVRQARALSAQKTANSDDEALTMASERQLACNEEMPKTAKPRIEEIRRTLWSNNLRGY